jgi:hypothetical protein
MTRAPRSAAKPGASATPARPPILAECNIMIGTPAYGGMVHIEYLRRLFEYSREGIQFQLDTIGNESLITRARNAILATFHARRELTHLLFLDADTSLPASGLIRMLMARAPVIGAPVALKGFDANGARIWNVGRCVGVTGSLLKVENVGTAALLLSRAACDVLVEDAIAHGRTYARAKTLVGNTDTSVHYDVFRVGVHDKQYLSEDYWVCRRLQTLGFDVLIDPTIVTTHYGAMPV